MYVPLTLLLPSLSTSPLISHWPGLNGLAEDGGEERARNMWREEETEGGREGGREGGECQGGTRALQEL